MAAAQYDLEMVRGDYFERQTFIMTGSDSAHIDFTGWTAKAQARIGPNVDGEPLIEFICGINDDGDPYIEATGAQTAAVGAISEAGWDLQLTSPGSKPKTFISGKVTITPDYTRA